MTLSTTTFSIIAHRITTLSMMTYNELTISVKAEICYAKCRLNLVSFMLSKISPLCCLLLWMLCIAVYCCECCVLLLMLCIDVNVGNVANVVNVVNVGNVLNVLNVLNVVNVVNVVYCCVCRECCVCCVLAPFYKFHFCFLVLKSQH
jgi:hypothetical protein